MDEEQAAEHSSVISVGKVVRIGMLFTAEIGYYDWKSNTDLRFLDERNLLRMSWVGKGKKGCWTSWERRYIY